MNDAKQEGGPAMRRVTTLILLTAVAVLGIAVHPLTGKTTSVPDPILQSFEREMNRVPTPTAPVRRDDIERDRLYEMINAARWTHDGPEAASGNELARRNEDEEPEADR